MKRLTEGKYFLPYDRSLVERAKEMRKNPTAAERKLWQFLRTFPLKMWRQRPIDRFIVDFYCPKLKLVIEVDGAQHFTPEGRERDRQRTARLESYGLKVIRFTNAEVLNEFDAVCEVISQYLTS
ncbi:MAG: endonuclease domain-containing protein [Cyanobacteria bacterium SID2]|nr:endonuclease domain-containing protein [Cyanobacteria bacterium SID2]